MPITNTQKQQAETIQLGVARDTAPQVRIVAGPGTGKTDTIVKRVHHLLNNGVNQQNIYVISFTRATCEELRSRIQSQCSNLPCISASFTMRISTMHALALHILRRANLLISYPSTPIIIDNWEQRNIYDREFANTIGRGITRAKEIRLAYDAQWQTLDPQYISQAQITQSEQIQFRAFHNARTNLYSCILPGELIFKCVDALRNNIIQQNQLPQIEHLIVDEFQDLNACDQEFIRLLSTQNTTLFIAGDDDQSIYSFRHANPEAIVNFHQTYLYSNTHILNDCFRCTPAILNPASVLIQNNPNRVAKNITSLYANAIPPVQGQLKVWSFNTAQEEATAIAESCHELITAGMAGQEDEIIILIANRRVQLETIVNALNAKNLDFEKPQDATANENEPLRAVYSLLRILKELATQEPNYLAYRDLLELLSGVGSATAKSIGDACISNNQNFHDLFLLPATPGWLSKRAAAAVSRISSIIQQVQPWNLNDTLGNRATDIANVLFGIIFTSGKDAATYRTYWNRITTNTLIAQMELEEFFQLLSADTDSEEQMVFNAVQQRLGTLQTANNTPPQKKIRMMTMHGAKGLSGKVVFIPSANQGIIPNDNSLKATGLLMEQRRLFYVSVTRARACCIISHCNRHTGSAAMSLVGRSVCRLPRSQFVGEMQIPTVNRTAGLTNAEAVSIVSDINNL